MKTEFEEPAASCTAISSIALPIYYKRILRIRGFLPAAGDGSGNNKSVVQHVGCALTVLTCAATRSAIYLPLCTVNLPQRVNQGEPNSLVATGQEDLLKAQKIAFSIYQ